MRFYLLLFFLLFYLFGILQNSFFIHFALFGVVPDIVFVLFYTILFFEKKNHYLNIFLCAVAAGLFTDFFSYHSIGISVAAFLLCGLATKKLEDSLLEKTDQYPVGYFLGLFIFSFLLYILVSEALLYWNVLSQILADVINWHIPISLIYNSCFAVVGIYVYKKFQSKKK